jgi:peptide/nickel transport system substrate-binding protein
MAGLACRLGRAALSTRRTSFLAVALSAALVLAVGASASRNAANQGPQAGGTLTSAAFAAAANAPSTLFPVFNPSVDTVPEIFMTLDQIWRPLIWVGTNLKVDWSKSVASSVTPNANYTVYDIKMHPNYTWTDGTPVTAYDQYYEWNLIKADCPSAKKCNWFYASGYFPSSVTKFQVVGKFEFKIYLDQPLAPNWFDLNGLTGLAPIPAQSWSINPTTHAKICSDMYCANPSQALADWTLLNKLGADPTLSIWQVADGPFLPGPWVRDQSYTLLRNPNYTGGHKAYLDKIVFLYYTTDDAEFNALKAGDLDVGYVPLSDIAENKISGFTFDNIPEWGYNNILVNEGNLNNPSASQYCRLAICEIFNMLPVRAALQEAIDQPALADKVFHGYAPVTTTATPPAPPTYLDPSTKVPYYPYNLTKAKDELTGAGFKLVNGVMTYEGKQGKNLPPDGTPFTFTLLYTSVSPYITEESLVWQAALKQIGVDVTLKGETPDAIFGTIFPSGNTKWQAVLFPAGDTFTPAVYPTGETTNTCNGSTFNVYGYCNPKMDALIKDTLSKPGMSYYYQYENFAAEQAPVLFLPTAPVVSYEVRNNIGGFASELNPASFSPLEDLYLKK